jgi:Tfp pilus assembly protein PilF
LLLTGCRNVAEERFLADARINGKTVRFAYDTGADGTVVFTRPAKRLGLKLFKPPPLVNPVPGESNVGHTGLCRFTVGVETFTLKLQTLHLPWPIGNLFDVDGLIGWPDIKDDIIEIDATADVIRGLDKLPDTNGWIKLPVYQRTGVLALQIPRADGATGVVEVDTGNPGGISLSPERWDKWRATHPHAHGKHNIDFMPGSGTGIGRTFKAHGLTLGPLTWTSVIVNKAHQTEMGIVSPGDVFEASMGIAALKPFQFIVDQKGHAAYFRLRTGASTLLAQGARASADGTLHLRFREHEYRDLAQDAFDSRKFAEALAEINRLLAAQPDDVEALYFRGDVCYSLHQWEGAVKDFRRACELDPDNANYPQYYMWVIRSRSGHRAEADQALAAYLGQRKKSNGDPWESRIGAFLLGRVTEADFFQAASRRSDDRSAHRCEAWFYAGMKRRLAGDIATARDYYQRCLATGQKDEDEYCFATAELAMPE